MLRACDGVLLLTALILHTQVGTWMHGFAFDAMPEEQLAAARKELRIIIFPGSTILSKRLSATAPPPPSPRHLQVRLLMHGVAVEWRLWLST